jgi:transposase-like protein
MTEAAEKADAAPEVSCPWCESSRTQLVSPYGPSVAEMQYKCLDCGQGFGWMKWEHKLPEA